MSLPSAAQICSIAKAANAPSPSALQCARERAAEIAVDHRPAERAQRVAAGLDAVGRTIKPRLRRQVVGAVEPRNILSATPSGSACAASSLSGSAGEKRSVSFAITPGGTATIAARAAMLALRRDDAHARARMIDQRRRAIEADIERRRVGLDQRAIASRDAPVDAGVVIDARIRARRAGRPRRR